MATKHTITLGNGSGLVIALDAVSRITETFSGKATQIPTANRAASTDHFIRNNATFNIDGVISGVLNPNDPVLTVTAEITERLRSLIETPQLVRFISGDRAYKDCFMENITLKRTVVEGVSGWGVACVLTQVQIALGGDDSVVRVNNGVSDDARGKTNIGGSSTEEVNVINLSIISGVGTVLAPIEPEGV